MCGTASMYRTPIHGCQKCVWYSKHVQVSPPWMSEVCVVQQACTRLPSIDVRSVCGTASMYKTPLHGYQKCVWYSKHVQDSPPWMSEVCVVQQTCTRLYSMDVRSMYGTASMYKTPLHGCQKCVWCSKHVQDSPPWMSEVCVVQQACTRLPSMDVRSVCCTASMYIELRLWPRQDA